MSTIGLALLNQEGKVVTIVRPDVPDGWTPPEGLTALPADQLPEGWEYAAPSDPVPQEVTPRQLRLALLNSNIDPDGIRATLDQIPDEVTRKQAIIEWEYALAIQREHPMLEPLAAMIGITHDQLDDLFRLAVTY